MPICTAIYLQDGVWYMQTLAQVSPPFPKLTFAGSTQEEQAQAVQKLGNLMRADDGPEMVKNIPSLFPDAESPAQEIYNQAFGWADSMQLPGQASAITAEQFGEETVDEAFPEFADLLLAFFGLAVFNGSSKLETMRIARVLERTIPGAAKQILSAAGSFTYEMTFLNYTEDTFTLNDFEMQVQEGLTTITQEPSGPLTSGETQTLAWTEMLSNVASGDTWGYIIYFIPSTSTWFGVKIIVPIQVFDIGPAPYYQVWVNGAWKGDYTSQPYTFSSDTGYSIVVSPVAGHTSLSVQVQINGISDAVREKLKAPPLKGQQGRKVLTDHEKMVQAEWTKALQGRKRPEGSGRP